MRLGLLRSDCLLLWVKSNQLMVVTPYPFCKSEIPEKRNCMQFSKTVRTHAGRAQVDPRMMSWVGLYSPSAD